MTRPRQVVSGRTFMLTRRCTQRMFLLRPGERTNQAVLYCLAEAAERFGMTILWAMVCSNHVHIGIFDERGRFPAFIEHFHKMTARVMNAHWGRWENFWATEQTSVVELATAAAVFEKMIYSLTNPVKDQLVAHATDWPGFSSLVAQLHDKTLTVERPRWFFRPEGAMPERVSLRFCRPPAFAQLTQRTWTDMIRAAVADEERTAEEERKGGRVLGRKAVLRQSAFARPESHEPRRELSPRVAAKNKWRRIEALRRNRDFQERYREAFALRRAGSTRVVFPHGTYKLHRLGLVRCEPPPP